MDYSINPPNAYYRNRASGAGLLAFAAGALSIYALYRMSRHRNRMNGPATAPRRPLFGGKMRGWREQVLVGRTVTINRPREELFAFWRDFSNFPRFMDNVISVTALDGDRAKWVIAAPAGGTVEFTTTITEEQPGEMIAWASDEDAEIRNSGRIVFRDAPGGRGTQVEATIAYDAPGGTMGRVAAKLLQREPEIQTRRELKRFKQLMETGEVSVARPHATA